MSHHGDDASKVGSALREVLEDLEQPEPREFAKERLGPTGNFPRGRLNAGDEGEIRVAVAADKGTVVLAFGAPIAWLGCSPEEAVEIADSIKRCADQAAEWMES